MIPETMRLTKEQYAAILKALTAALEDAKYYPATVGGWFGPEAKAKKILKRFAPLDMEGVSNGNPRGV